LNAGASNVFLFDYSGSIFATERSSTGASSSYQSLASLPALPYWLKLVRSGNVFTLSGASDGVHWVQLESQTVSMGQNAYIGLAVSSDATSSLATATFDNVSFTTPGPPPPSFLLSASPSSLATAQGASGTSTIPLTPQNAFTDTVTLPASALPTQR